MVQDGDFVTTDYFLSTTQKIGWEDYLQSDLFCVKCNIKT